MANRHLERVQRFESLLEPFSSSAPSDPSPPSDGPDALAAVGESVPGLGRGPQSAEQWRKDELRRLCFQGIPDEPKHLRPAAYTFLLALPPLPDLVEQYAAFVADISARVSSLPPPASPETPATKDQLLKEIQQDVDRTFGALAWFGAEVELLDGEGVLWERLAALKRGIKEQGVAAANGGAGEGEGPRATDDIPHRHTRRRALLRPLFVYAFLNPGVSYVQGMSYLAAVLFFVFSAAPTTSPLQAEAASFFALGALLSQLRDLYVPTLDAPSTFSTSAVGLGATIARFNSLLLFLDPAVADALDRKGVDLSGLVMRWLTTMFANEFPLPDVVRVWDRIVSLHPPVEGHQPVESLSPVLSHLLDLALAVVEMERQTIISPFAKMPKILGVLQDLPIEGEGIDKLIRTASDIRERRLGRSSKRASVSSTPTRSGTVFGRRLWSASPAKSADAAAAEFELDGRSSAAGSETSRPSRLGNRFGSLAFSSPRTSATADLADNVTVVEGKVLPPPPARIDQPPNTIAALIEDELRAEAEYGVDDEDGDGAEDAASLRDRAASGWGGLKSSLSRFAASDTAAALQKRATNLQLAAAQSASTASVRLQSSDAAAALFKAQSNATAKAQLLREQLAQETPERLAKLRDAGGRLVASTGAERGEHRPGSPRETPFTPPGAAFRDRDVSPLSSPRLGAAADMAGGGSNGPKPLLLSSAARRARSDSDSAGSPSVVFAHSPSQSPVISRTAMLSPDLSIPLLSRSPSAHGRSASQFESPSRAPPAAGSFRPRSPSLQQATSGGYSLHDEDSPIVSRRVQEGAAGLRRGGPAIRTREDGSPAPSGRPAQAAARGGWSLSDAPVRPSAGQEIRVDTRLPLLDMGFDPAALSESVEPSSALARLSVRDEPTSALSATSVRDEPAQEEPFLPPREEPFAPPTEQPFAPPSEAPFVPPGAPTQDEPFYPPSSATALPPRGSSLALSASQPASSAIASSVPPRQSSLASSTSASSPIARAPASPADAAPKLTRRPPAQRKRTARLSQHASIDLLSGPEARRVASEFLTRSSSGSGGGGSHRRRASEALKERGGEFDEAVLVDMYGHDDTGER